MISAQIERLKKDARQLEYSAARLRKNGDTERMRRVLLKKTYLEEHIAEIEETLVA